MLYSTQFMSDISTTNDVFMRFSINEQNMEGEGEFRHDFTELDVCPEDARQIGHGRDKIANMIWNSSG